MTKSFLFCSFLAVSSLAHAQTTTPTPVPGAPTGGTPTAPSRPAPVATAPFATLGGFSLSGYLRSRVENYNFFDATGFDDNYTFTGHQLRLAGVRSTPKLDIQIDLQQQLLTNLPERAIAPPPRGLLGLGANYFAANGNQDGALNVKQAFVRFKGAVGAGSNARLGRFEFNEGAETVNPNATLNFLKTQRISQRLVGTFGFSHTGRAFDGIQLNAPLARGNFSGVLARPTEGVFQLEANDNIDETAFLYGAYTQPLGTTSEARLFGLVYDDGRETDQSTKVDNRPLPLRQADNDRIRVSTLGANYIRTFPTQSGTFDALAWGALQGGSWGNLDHSANAFALEAGYQPTVLPKLRPWLRVGYYRPSGDGNNADGDHKTFFTPLPTPRLYARFPFYNQMNTTDLFAQLILRPNPKTNVRLEAHRLRLTNAADLFYAGGGAFQDGGNGVNGFGFAGRPSGGSRDLANLLDISFDYNPNPRTSFGLYFGQAFGGDVIDNIFDGDKGSLAFFEFTRRF